MIDKWLIEKLTDEKIKNRYILKIKCDFTDIKIIIEKFKSHCGKYYDSEEVNYNYFLYLYNFTENELIEINEFLQSNIIKSKTLINISDIEISEKKDKIDEISNKAFIENKESDGEKIMYLNNELVEEIEINSDILNNIPVNYKIIRVLFVIKKEDEKNIDKIRYYFYDLLQKRDIKYYFEKKLIKYYESEDDIRNLIFDETLKEIDLVLMIGDKKLSEYSTDFKNAGKYFKVLEHKNIDRKYALFNLAMEIIFKK